MTTIKFRRDTSANWTSVNPIPAQGEPCYETDTGKLKIGNGSDNYVALPYVSDGGGSSGDLPIATATTLGGIKVGNNLSITEDGTLSANGGSAGTTDYTQLENKPQINSVELTGNKTLDDLGIQAKGNYLTTLPDNAVTTDTNQTISGDKTFTRGITTTDIYPAGEITFTQNSQYRYINYIDTISGGYHAQNGYITFKGDTTLVGDNKLVLNGHTGGLKLTADSTANITCENELVAPNIRTTANGTIKLTHPTNAASGLITLNNNYGQLSISSSLEGNNNLLGVTSGTTYALINGDNITTKDKDGNLYYYINSKNITNCLLEVPQRIKLELNNGTLTLKAGSQVIIPNGFEADGTTPKFDKVVIKSDIVRSNFSTASDKEIFIHYVSNENSLSISTVSLATSGTTEPTSSNYIFYNTRTNYLYDQNGLNKSFPIAICTLTPSGVTSIDQVFNGIGYFGSTVWVDKGVKGLTPNGRNEDGSLNNIEFTTQNILLRNNTEKGSYYLVIVDGGTRISIANYSSWVFDEKSNRILNDGVIRDNIGFCGDITLDTGGVITSFQSKQSFRAVDYNDKSEISGWGMPSNRYIDLTLGKDGTTYTAPANGWFVVSKRSTKANEILALYSTATGFGFKYASAGAQGCFVSCPVKKGDEIACGYTTTGATEFFRFIYAEGSK